MDVVLYLRYSSDRQTEQSIEGQERVCTNFCKQQGYNIVDKYYDRALSASKDTAKRIDFQKMIKDSEKGLFEAVIVYKLDRFSRNRYDNAIYKSKLKKNGVKVISATENISDNPEGVILESVLEGMAEFYSKELSQKVTRGMYESARKCQSFGGMPLLGYKVENKKWVIDEEKAPIVVEAYKRYANGESIISIINDFNERGLRTNKGNKFNKSTFQRVFGNEKYIGIYSFQDLRVENGVPALIDKDTFEIVRKRRFAISEAPKRGKAKVEFLLSGKIFCGHCEKNMTGCTGTSKTKNKYYYYECPTHKKFHACKKKPVRKELIEEAVVQETNKLLTPEIINMIAEKVEQLSAEEKENNLLRKSIENEIKDYERSLKNLIRIIEVGGSDLESISIRIKELEAKKKDALKRLSFATEADLYITKDMVLFFFDKFMRLPRDSEDHARILIDTLVNSVIVYDEDDGSSNVRIDWNLDGYAPSDIFLSNKSSHGGSLCSPLNSCMNTYYISFNKILFVEIYIAREKTVK